jgi:hypothetical protein
MTDRTELHFDDEGFVDMDGFRASDPEAALDPATYARLREVLAQAPVPAPSSERFEQWIERAVEQAPDALDTASLVPPAAAPDNLPDDLGPTANADPASWHDFGAHTEPDIDADIGFEEPDETDQT